MCPRMDNVFSLHSHLVGYEHPICVRRSSNPNWPHRHMFHDLWSSYGYLILFKVNILVLIEWSYIPSLPSKIMLIIDLVMVSIFWGRNVVSFRHMFLWCKFFRSIPNYIPFKHRCLDINILSTINIRQHHKCCWNRSSTHVKTCFTTQNLFTSDVSRFIPTIRYLFYHILEVYI